MYGVSETMWDFRCIPGETLTITRRGFKVSVHVVTLQGTNPYPTKRESRFTSSTQKCGMGYLGRSKEGKNHNLLEIFY